MQDVVLAESLLPPPSVENLLKLTGQCLLPGKKQIAGQLHGEGAGAPRRPPSLQVRDQGGADIRQRETGMLEETGILLHQDGINQPRTDGRQDAPPLRSRAGMPLYMSGKSTLCSALARGSKLNV